MGHPVGNVRISRLDIGISRKFLVVVVNDVSTSNNEPIITHTGTVRLAQDTRSATTSNADQR